MGFAPLSNGRHLCLPVPSAPVGVFRPPLLGFVTRFRRGPVLGNSPFIDLIPGVRLPAARHCWRPASDSMACRIAFRPRRFARPRRFSPPIAQAFTRLFLTIHGAEGLASLLHLAADRRVRCVSAVSSRGASPGSPTIAGRVPCWSQRLRFPHSEVRTPRRILPACSSMCCHTSPTSPSESDRVTALLASSDFAFLPIRDRRDDPVAGLVPVVVSRGRGPPRLCSAGGSVPAHTVFGRVLAYPPWALFPFEVYFVAIPFGLAGVGDALHHLGPRLRTVAVA
jgi:hypothetical protein